MKVGGALTVGFGVFGSELFKTSVQAAVAKNSLDPGLPASWFEIRADNTILMRTGRSDFGQSTVTTAFKQLAAEELNVPFEAITDIVMGDTDRTPDGGLSADYLGRGGDNIRKAAAYTYQALLELAALKLGVEKTSLSVKDGIVSGGGKTVSYGQLVQGQQWTLRIPVRGDLTSIAGLTVDGNPPVKPRSQYTVVGKSYANYVTASKVAAKEQWITSIQVPNMLHARVVHPKTLGSTLKSAGKVDQARYPNSRVVVVGNLVGVVAPNEWEAVGAAQQVASSTEWTDWKGLPGSDRLFQWMREQVDWKANPPKKSDKSQGDVSPALAGATKKLSATYEIPFMKHASIGPTVSIADVRQDGSVYLHVHNQNAQALRGEIAQMLSTSIDNVIVRTYAGAGHYGRSNGGNSGSECEAVLLSRAIGRPVRLQWSRADDLMWSTQHSAGFSNIEIGMDGNGRIVAYQADHHMPPMQDDRLIGALLAGLPTLPAPEPINQITDPWVYDRVPNVLENGRSATQFGQKASPLAVGLRDHSMRTPGQLQQNFPRELALTEAAALAGVDPLEFRLNHTKDERLIGVLKAVRDAAGWQSRPSPSLRGTSLGSRTIVGRGVSAIFRFRGYWACVCEISVTPSTGAVSVQKYTIAVDPGIVINPRQLKRQVEGGSLMGISHALHEEMLFDESNVTSRDWRTYPILTMAEVPEVKVVIIDRPESTQYGGGSEAANALAVSSIAAAFFDATGKVARRLPLKPAYVRSLLGNATGSTAG
jgi:CO/xanthine dehydrogenase Mo-binding subunit